MHGSSGCALVGSMCGLRKGITYSFQGMTEWTEIDSIYLKFRSQSWFWVFSLLFCAQKESLNRRQLDVQDSVFPPPTPSRGQLITLRAFMMHNKDIIWANIGMHYLVIKAFQADAGTILLVVLASLEAIVQEIWLTLRTIAALPTLLPTMVLLQTLDTHTHVTQIILCHLIL